ncbi:hypothetical protein ABIA32_005298 [Streptacidiphilus sp. MAP12-20]|uniref:hypothetical protein n=1 Tax=Streptacidiphilus sp. MAP12-20 TaxID=3156299 RepID=UPI00351291E8
MVSIPRRSPLTWVVCALLSAGAWALLLTDHTDAGLGLMFAGGWNLSLLPVHAMKHSSRRGKLHLQGRGELRE